jgi:hypothetical protein
MNMRRQDTTEDVRDENSVVGARSINGSPVHATERAKANAWRSKVIGATL